MKAFNYFASGLIFCSVILLSACNTERENDPPEAGSAEALNTVLANIVDAQIIPGMESFKTESQSLSNQALLFCNTSDATNLASLQAQWKTLSSQWNRVAIYNLGPLNDDPIFPVINFIESMRQNGQDYTDTVRAEIATALADVYPLNDSYFNGLSFTRTGILALEVLIFESTVGTHSTDASDIVTDYQSNARKCDYLKGMAQLLSRQSDALHASWNTDYQSSGKAFRDVFLDAELEDGTEPAAALITAIQQHLDYLNRRKIGLIHDAKIADYFFQNIEATLLEIEQLLEGSDAELYSVFDHMLNGGFDSSVEQVRNNLTAAKQAVTSNDESNLDIYIGYLDGNFKDEIPEALEVTLGINFSDGD